MFRRSGVMNSLLCKEGKHYHRHVLTKVFYHTPRDNEVVIARGNSFSLQICTYCVHCFVVLMVLHADMSQGVKEDARFTIDTTDEVIDENKDWWCFTTDLQMKQTLIAMVNFDHEVHQLHFHPILTLVNGIMVDKQSLPYWESKWSNEIVQFVLGIVPDKICFVEPEELDTEPLKDFMVSDQRGTILFTCGPCAHSSKNKILFVSDITIKDFEDHVNSEMHQNSLAMID